MIDIKNSLIDQFASIHSDGTGWQKEDLLSYEEAVKYWECVLDKGRVDYVLEGDILLGYVESWCVDFTQWGRLVCHEPFSPLFENVNDGAICYLSDIWINPEHRRSNVIRILKLKFFHKNFNCDFFVGKALRKRPTQPIKVFKRQEFYDKYIDKESNNG